MEITKLQLEDGEYYKEVTIKKTIVLHHTAGGPNAINVISGAWEHDKTANGGKLPVATSYVIGGKMLKIPEMDGKIYEAFDDKYYAHHLGCKTKNNLALNKQSIGIEICNWGPIVFKPGKNGVKDKYLTYVGTELTIDEVYKLDKPFRGYTYYHEYTDAQIMSLKLLLLHLSEKHKINIKKAWNLLSFELSKEALAGDSGIWCHTNYRADKFDISPSPKMIAMLNSLNI